MKRTNILKLTPKKEEENILFELADNSSRMYNEINYKRRQSFFAHNFNWNTDEEYQKYSSRSILSDWWYWAKQIAEHQAELKKIGKKSSRRLRKLYRKRKRRFRQAVNTIIANF